MAYEPQSFPGFGGGLNLRDKADAVAEEEAIDALNVEFTERGAVAQRSGYSVFTSTALDGQGDTLFPHYESDGTRQLLVGDTATGQLTALDTGGAEVDIENSLSNGGCFGFARFGAPGNEYTYIGNGVDELWFWNGTVFANVPDDTGSREPPKGGALAVTPTSNRLVNARFTVANTTGGPNATTSTPSHVFFSDPGNPVVWGDNNFVQLSPGDGEAIQDIVAWREFLFVFKETKFFVFTQESQDSTGEPVFNYYAVNTGQGACGPRAVTADETGVYFASRNGVYLTTGGEPVEVSDSISPIFKGGASDYFTGGVLEHGGISAVAVNAFDGKVYVNYPHTGASNTRTLVYDTEYKWWSLWDIAAADMAPFRSTSQERLFFTYPTGNNEVAVIDGTADDAGTAISSHWRSGWFDYGLSIVKTIRETKVWGYGVLQLGISWDFRLDVGTLTELRMEDPTSDTWGGTIWGGGVWASPAGRLNALRRNATRGTVFSTTFRNTTLSQEWTIARLDHHLRESRIPSIKTAVAS